ncbi:endonuclease/exonuclease/phosphatase family protein [Stratiformator vulcanicus]|uniref:Endonuclease/Exonuclease/phosphatase family protein n=1 Tax=Stratiformator vulcanicus TaxID=2527980 RepID=A0A517R1P6_9PLAN|nr:endonuclease/exonuclease/phosphatase family protein [Stratiformator vulcanicus]QDT37781.1 Endonuclease/Exonuclease/phosphatase family protein [Stratiformator vulcanicus]
MLLARLHWFCEALTSFPLQLTLGTIPFAIGFMIARMKWWAVAAGALVAINGLILLSGMPINRQSDVRDGPKLRIASANVRTDNRDHASFLKWAEAARPDVLAVLEVDARWANVLDELDFYPYQIVDSRNDNFGIALLSTQPFEMSRILFLADSDVPTIVARIRLEDETWTIIATHPLPPVGNDHWGARNRHLAALAALSKQQDGRVIICGDLNTSPWSPFFGDLLRDGRVKDSRAGFGYLGTWPDHQRLLWTPIDHILVSHGMVTTSRTVGPPIGSDHRPVSATIIDPSPK